MISEGPNPISPCPSLHTPARSKGGWEPQSTCLGFPALAPFLSCTYEDFFIVVSQEGTRGFDSLLRNSNPTQLLPLPQVSSSQISPKPPPGPHRNQPGPEPEVGQRS